MNIKIKHQVSATYARNNFKEINERAIKDGICVIVKKSKPITVILPVEKYEQIKKRSDDFDLCKIKRPTKKITLEELRANSDFDFDKFAGTFEKKYGNISSVELSHKWTEYVD
jgi:prevent-host-death family protein